MYGVHHRCEPQHALPRAHDRHSRRGSALVVEARVPLDDQTDPCLGVGHELLGVHGRGIVAVSGPLQHRRPVQPVPQRRRPTDAQRLQHPPIPNHSHGRTVVAGPGLSGRRRLECGDQPAVFGTPATTANIVSAIEKRSSRAAWWIVDTNPCRWLGER